VQGGIKKARHYLNLTSSTFALLTADRMQRRIEVQNESSFFQQSDEL